MLAERCNIDVVRRFLCLPSALTLFACLSLSGNAAVAQSPPQPDWVRLQDETIRHFQAILRLDTSNPPGSERRVAEYLKQVFDQEGIPARVVALDTNRS